MDRPPLNNMLCACVVVYPSFSFMVSCTCSTSSVSYTHLDVYKRQVNNSEENSLLLIDKIEEENSAEEELLNQMVLRELFTALSDKDREIIIRSYYYNETQSQIAARLGISQVQVSRLEKKILKQMREKI